MKESMGIHIGKVIRHAVVFNTQRWPEARFGMDDLLDAVNDLFDLLQKRRISYALVGGIALLRYVQETSSRFNGILFSYELKWRETRCASIDPSSKTRRNYVL